jgi:hypothetical protein
VANQSEGASVVLRCRGAVGVIPGISIVRVVARRCRPHRTPAGRRGPAAGIAEAAVRSIGQDQAVTFLAPAEPGLARVRVIRQRDRQPKRGSQCADCCPSSATTVDTQGLPGYTFERAVILFRFDVAQSGVVTAAPRLRFAARTVAPRPWRGSTPELVLGNRRRR